MSVAQAKRDVLIDMAAELEEAKQSLLDSSTQLIRAQKGYEELKQSIPAMIDAIRADEANKYDVLANDLRAVNSSIAELLDQERAEHGDTRAQLASEALARASAEEALESATLPVPAPAPAQIIVAPAPAPRAEPAEWEVIVTGHDGNGRLSNLKVRAVATGSDAR